MHSPSSGTMLWIAWGLGLALLGVGQHLMEKKVNLLIPAAERFFNLRDPRQAVGLWKAHRRLFPKTYYPEILVMSGIAVMASDLFIMLVRN